MGLKSNGIVVAAVDNVNGQVSSGDGYFIIYWHKLSHQLKSLLFFLRLDFQFFALTFYHSRLSDLKKWRLARKPCELNFVFPNEAGGLINHNNMVTRDFKPALKKAGIGPGTLS